MKNLLLFMVSVLLLASCVDFKQEQVLKDALSTPMRHLVNYRFNEASAVISRLRSTEPFLLKYLQEMDQDTNYRNYNLTPAEKITVSDALDKLPPLNKKILKERLVGLYFVENLFGSALTDWLTDDKGEIFCVMIINPLLLKMNISEWLTWKENTVFHPENAWNRVSIECGRGLSAMLGILTHESTHAVDYVKNVTPFVEPATLYYDKSRNKKTEQTTDFVKGIWDSYGQPAKNNDFVFRKSVRFYSADTTNRIPISSADECYRQLTASPFVSLYGSKMWAEDLAETVLFYHVTGVLKQPYTITVQSMAKEPPVYRPMENPKVQKRLEYIRKTFYE